LPRDGVTNFGAGAAFYANCMKAGLDLADCGDLSRMRAWAAPAPAVPEVQQWGTDQFARLGTPGIWWNNISGGTDFCGAFIGGNRELPLVAGEMQCRQLGAAVEAWDEQGQPVVDAVGELVCTQPIPSMPLYFWGDRTAAATCPATSTCMPPAMAASPAAATCRLRQGVWRHGDWLRIGAQGGCTIYGRSDATINRHGLRMGTSEIYSAVEALPEVLDSMVVDLEYLGKESYMPLFVVLREG
jgi:acetoacetyl-CoA synthetase